MMMMMMQEGCKSGNALSFEANVVGRMYLEKKIKIKKYNKNKKSLPKEGQ